MLGFSETLQLRLMLILKQTMAANTQAQNVGASGLLDPMWSGYKEN
jgi:hypothetical protein